MESKKIFFIIFIASILTLAFYFLIPKTKELVIKNSLGKKIYLRVEIADSEVEQEKGLSGRENLGKNRGMFFVFEDKKIRSFWMKNMKFSIDIIWIEDNKIVNISKNLIPEGENPQKKYSSGKKVNFVLEVPASFCEKNNIKIGNKITYNF